MPQTLWTADMVRALPDDGKRYEVVDGELLVTPSPARLHQRAVGEVFTLLKAHAEATRTGIAFVSPSDIELDRYGLVQPDVFVEAAVDGRVSLDWNNGAPLLLFVEVLSPSTGRADRTIKRRRFQRAGIPEYWIVDLDARLVERWRPDDTRPEILTDTITWEPGGGAPALVIALGPLFDRIFSETL